MRKGFAELPDWSFEVDEVSGGVYEVTATDSLWHRVQMTGTNDEALVTECRKAALKLAASLNR